MIILLSNFRRLRIPDLSNFLDAYDRPGTFISSLSCTLYADLRNPKQVVFVGKLAIPELPVFESCVVYVIEIAACKTGLRS